MRDLIFMGSSQDDLREFPAEARREAGFALWQAQAGKKSAAAVPMKGFGGASVIEIRVDDDGDTFRTIYTVAFANAVYVLHAFQKRSKSGIATTKRDIDLIRQRLKEARADAGK